MISSQIDRRQLIAAVSTLPLGMAIVRNAEAAQDSVAELVIDLPGPPESIDPALAYSPRDWSIVHSIYDSLIMFDENGDLVPLAAESFTTTDATTFLVKLRSGLSFHDGTPVTAEAIARSIEYVKASESYAVDLFATIERVEVIDELNASVVCSSPSPWLAAQIAVWVLLIPEGFTAASAAEAPVGSGPYVFESYDPGNEIVLARYKDYSSESPKGVAIADRVVYRFVPEATTRVADLASGSAQIVTEIPIDQEGAVVDAGGTLRAEPIVGIGFIRIPNDVEPFVDVRVRQAMNHAVDFQAIATALLGDEVKRIATVYPDERALGFDSDLDPYDYDVEKARDLLSDAGYPEGFSTQLEVTSAARVDVAEAIIDQLGEVGIKVELVSSDLATFNAGWSDRERPALRMVTWSPLFEPYTFLSFIFVTGGFLARYSNGEVDAAFAAASAEADPEVRSEHLQEVGRILHDDPAAIYMWNLVTSYGISKDAEAWTPRGDEYVIAASVEG